MSKQEKKEKNNTKSKIIKVYCNINDLTPTESRNSCMGKDYMDDERAEWLESMKTEGINKPITVDAHGVILDGNFRFWFCQSEYSFQEFIEIDAVFLAINDDYFKRLYLENQQLREVIKRQQAELRQNRRNKNILQE